MHFAHCTHCTLQLFHVCEFHTPTTKMHKVPVIYSRLKTEVYFTQLNFSTTSLQSSLTSRTWSRVRTWRFFFINSSLFFFAFFKCSTGVGVVNLLNCFGSCAFYTESFASISLLPDVFKAQLLLLELFFLVRFNWGLLPEAVAGMCNVDPRGLPCLEFELEVPDLRDEQEGEDTGGLVTGSLRPLGSSWPLSSAELWSVW